LLLTLTHLSSSTVSILVDDIRARGVRPGDRSHHRHFGTTLPTNSGPRETEINVSS
jgi:hypothetical protein